MRVESIVSQFVAQDGRGTVDSGHYVVDGYNEVIMLRRLPPRHKQKIMNTDLGVCAKEFDKSFALPHSDQTVCAVVYS